MNPVLVEIFRLGLFKALVMLVPLGALGVILYFLYVQVSDTKEQLNQMFEVVKDISKNYTREGGQYE